MGRAWVALKLAIGKVDVTLEQMVFAEATTVAPLIVSDVYHREASKPRKKRRFADMFEGQADAHHAAS
ncbi:hypothetical protein HXX25_09310 [Hyphobacterium sp. CCMP332]|uniref:hypothetical protein n=1 Tax=Hyphobacterium sp. CCMP332 TaxID=2749086 RepID=UPI00164F0B55|nr:hypothetical protein [Hyphobacterium sp. CCMP332]QNL19495.1 hypothetical protein HXX25_09310 [Hyphobacterium sp. CCMP332]